MSIGTLRCIAVNVTDFDVGYRFWSAVTGWEMLGPAQGWHGWLGYLGTRHPPKHEMILIHSAHAPIRTPVPTHHNTNCMHIDITPSHGIDAAIGQILLLGGSVKKPPSLYPRPGSFGSDRPVIDWAVMQDPFGNEFCLVQDLTKEQSAAAVAAAERGVKDDRALREAAGQTGPVAAQPTPP
jgi:hypothetical protein